MRPAVERVGVAEMTEPNLAVVAIQEIDEESNDMNMTTGFGQLPGWRGWWTVAAGLVVAAGLFAQRPVKADKVQILSFRVTANRISPAALSVPRGRYVIKVNNGVFTGAAVEVIRGASERANGRVFSAGRGRDVMELELAPGAYSVRVGTNPNWRAQINVQ